jgi:hypothetical protein
MSALLGPAACGGDSTGPGDDPLSGDFTLTMSGDVTRTIVGDEGGFWEVTDAQTQQTVWVLSLSTGAASALEGIQILVGGNRPAPGDYTLSAADPEELEAGEGVAFVVANPSLSGSGFLGLSVSGSITVTESSAEVVRGTMLLTAQGNVFPPGQSAVPGLVLIDGSFQALLTEPETPEPIDPPTVNPM